MNKKPHWLETIVEVSLGFIIAAFVMAVIGFARMVLSIVRFVATKVWSLAFEKSVKAKGIAPAKSNGLPTPDIFKGAPNLAPARQVKF